jgi:hypothetical protein
MDELVESYKFVEQVNRFLGDARRHPFPKPSASETSLITDGFDYDPSP